MKTFLFFIVVVVLAAIGLRNYNTALGERDALNEKVASLAQEIEAIKKERDVLTRRLATLIPKPASATRIICPACHGEKISVLPMPGSNDPLKRTTQECPLCLGKGYKLLTIPEGKKICSDCQGMGLIYNPHPPICAANCVRCATTGLVISPK